MAPLKKIFLHNNNDDFKGWSSVAVVMLANSIHEDVSSLPGSTEYQMDLRGGWWSLFHKVIFFAITQRSFNLFGPMSASFQCRYNIIKRSSVSLPTSTPPQQQTTKLNFVFNFMLYQDMSITKSFNFPHFLFSENKEILRLKLIRSPFLFLI